MQSNLINSAMRGGLTLGALFSINFLLSISQSALPGMLSYAVVGLILYQTHRLVARYRDNELDGVIGFGHGLIYVGLLFVFASVVSAFVKYFYLQYFGGSYLENTYNQAMQLLEGILPEVPEEMYQSMETLTTPRGYTLMAAWSNMLAALPVAPIMAAIARRSKNDKL